jgi:hypothetical protein
LIGDKEPEETKVPEEIIDNESELDIEPLEDLDTTDLEGFDFTL